MFNSNQEEILYLSNLCLQAARWNRDPDEPLCAIELEVQDRLRRLCGVDTVDENGLAQSEPVKVNPRTHEGQCRILVDGKKKWVSKADCVKVPNVHSKTGYSWRLKDEKQRGTTEGLPGTEEGGEE